MTHTSIPMETSTSIGLQTLITNITVYLSGNTFKNISIIKINNDNLSMNGELHFLLSLKAWREVFEDKNVCNENCQTILQHFLHRNSNKKSDKNDADIAKEVFQLLMSASENWPIKIDKYSLQNGRICLFLNRVNLTRNIIKVATEDKENFGRCLPSDVTYNLESYIDKESELTTKRLHLIRDVTQKVLDLHGCKVSEKDSALQYVFTTKSQGNPECNYEKYICGVVKNSQSNSKETSLTWHQHIQNKISELEALNEHKLFDIEECNINKHDLLKDIANATAIFELLTVKPSRPVFVRCSSIADRSTTNTKGVSFILYNTARIETIIEKYNDKKLKGDYPDLMNINDIDFSLLQQEEEWELIYNFILGYPEMIKDCLKYKPTFQVNPHVICLFLARLCQKFSIYYRRIRILTEPYDHLMPTMMARMYMLYALRVVLQNALALLDIKPVARM